MTLRTERVAELTEGQSEGFRDGFSLGYMESTTQFLEFLVTVIDSPDLKDSEKVDALDTAVVEISTLIALVALVKNHDLDL